MKLKNTLIVLSSCLLLAGCGVKKKVAESGASRVESKPTWHTCVIQGARATVSTSEESFSANITMQTVRDSMIVISVMPMLSMEMLRLEATPKELTAIDKVHGRYMTSTFEAINKKLTPKMSWKILQQVCSAELPTGAEKAHLQYKYDEVTLDVVIEYTPRKLDVPVRMNRLRLDKYKKVDFLN